MKETTHTPNQHVHLDAAGNDEPFSLVSGPDQLPEHQQSKARPARQGKQAAANDQWYAGEQGGFFCLPRKLLHRAARHLDGAVFRTYVLLASHQFDGSPTFPSSLTLARLTTTDARNIRRHMDALVQAGLVQLKARKRGHEYTFLIPSEAQIAAGYAAFKLLQQSRKAKQSPTA